MNNVNVLVLVNGQADHVTSARRAVSLVEKNKADVVEPSDAVLRSPSRTISVPSVISVRFYRNVPKRNVKPTKDGVFTRDHYQCQYCGKQLAANGKGDMKPTIDHVIPKSHGGALTWTNSVTACLACNRRKGAKTPTQAGMTLRSEPKTPRVNYLILKGSKMRVEWKKYMEL
jgi:5-methylcytosine-specific restriction endonuclease McrA